MDTYKGGRGNKATFNGTLRLNNLENTRKSYARIIKCYAKGDMSENMGRALSYMLTGYLSYFKLIKDLQIEDRIEKLENTLESIK